MAIRVYCSEPASLLQTIKDTVPVQIPPWKVDADGDFTMTAARSTGQGWFRPSVKNDHLLFNILGRKTKSMTRGTYATYHGRFVEMLLTHFDDRFTRVTATALPDAGDAIAADED